MYSKINYTIVGFFIFTFTIALIFFAFWLGDKGDENNQKKYLLRVSESVVGLSKDSGIKMKGVNIGLVDKISINPNNIEEVNILISIQKDIPIKEDMRGVVKMYGLTGLSYIEITGGTNESKILEKKDNEKYPIIKSTSSLMGRIEGNFAMLSTRVMSILKQSEKLLSDENIDKFGTILSSIDKMSKKTLTLEDEAIYFIKNLRVVVNDINNSFDRVVNNLNIDISPALKSFITTSNRFDYTIKRGDYNFKKILQPMITDIRVLTTQIEDLSISLERSPSDIIFKSSTPKKGPGE